MPVSKTLTPSLQPPTRKRCGTGAGAENRGAGGRVPNPWPVAPAVFYWRRSIAQRQAH